MNESPLWRVDRADCLEWFAGLPADSADLVFGSPPYEMARTYGIGFALKDQAWVDWMVSIFKAALRVCKGLVAFVLEGQTRSYQWSAVPALLMADLHRAGVVLRKPPIYQRVGIPGSGGPDWLRNDYEFVVCATRGGKLPWSDNTAMGHKPKWAPGGEMSNRQVNGERVNGRDKYGMQSSNRRRPNGKRELMGTDGNVSRNVKAGAVSGYKNGDTAQDGTCEPPAIANPGNCIRCKVGGGLMGSKLAHENEAPFPEALAEFFVRSFAPPGGLVLDPFSGSGTTGAVAVRWGRRFHGCDVRQSQVDLSCRRIAGETPTMFPEGEKA